MKKLNIQFLLIQELGISVQEKITLLKSLNVLYTSALELIENKKYNEFLQKLDEQLIIENAIENVEKQISTTMNKYVNKNEIALMLSGSNDSSTFPPYLKKLSDNILASKKLIKSCKMLNEKLTFCAEQAQAEIKQNMALIKNRRLIKSGYNSHNSYEAGLVIDC